MNFLNLIISTVIKRA